MKVHPVFLRLEGRSCLVVGAGEVAERKIAGLLEAGARVRVVAPEATDEIRAMAGDGRITWVTGRFEAAQLDDAWFVVACTSDGEVQAEVARCCEERRIFCLAVDDVARATAFAGSVVRRPPFLIAISSSGEAPALTRLVREIVEHVLPPDAFVERARALRDRWKAEAKPHDERFLALVRELGYFGKGK